MSANATPLRRAITELMEGTIGTTRVVLPNVFKAGVFAGQPVAAQQARTMNALYSHRFDLRTGTLDKHGATPQSNLSSYKISRLSIEIPITTHLKSTVQDADREAIRARVLDDCDTAIQALAYPGNLDATAGAVATGIVTCLFHPDGGSAGQPVWEMVQEDWERHLLRSVIRASATLIIDQPIATS